jgi:hypothetical protein
MDESREHILLSVHSWLIRESGRTILIDTGAGNGKKRPYAPYFDGLNNPFLERLRAVGVAPEDIDYVLLTHFTSIMWAGTRGWKGEAGYLRFPKPGIYFPALSTRTSPTLKIKPPATGQPSRYKRIASCQKSSYR